MIEVLAPAGGVDSFKAAVLSGADAVYFGAGNFNARRNAKNFTTEDVRQCAAFARVRGVKTYLTLNTLLGDNELKAALDTALMAAECGIDALIVQDLGLAKLLRKYLPNMPIHASTQMSVHSAESLSLLKEMGFSRVVVAREMDKESLQKLCKEATRLGIEVEAFVHGALCMCLSGQCYLSSVLGGRSGNRGLCAQPCRLPFGVKNGTGHDLSLKDMSYISHITEMRDMGVTSFKIEGRMKRPEYVAAAVTAVKNAVLGKPVTPEIKELLSGIFSRSGHTDGYYKNALGVGMFGTRTDSDEKLSQKLINSAHELYRREIGRVEVLAEVAIKKNEQVSLTLRDNDKNSVTVFGEPPETALNREINGDFVAEKLQKCGGTPFIMGDVKCEIDGGLAVSGAMLNELRRNALLLLSEKRAEYDGSAVKDNTVSEFELEKHNVRDVLPKAIAYFRNSDQIPKDLSGVSAVILPCETDFSKVNIPQNIPVLADIPRGILHNIDSVLRQLQSAKENGVKAAVCGNLAGFRLAQKVGLVTVSGFGMNVFNTESVKAVADFGAKATVLSFEMSLDDAVHCGGNIPKGIISYGRLPLMLVRNCPNKNGAGCKNCNGKSTITDRKGIEFPIMCRGEFSEVFNSRPLWLFDRKKEMRGLDFEVLNFTDETPERCQEVLSAYRKNLSPDTDFTRGLYFREVY
ncbi:MAG: U32 family peptidase [Clostridia bacterium]|nr:U32 family peptidase [Clostridia bacterium]